MASSNPDTLSRDVAYAICANACRRRLLTHLVPGERRSVDDLARELTHTATDSNDGPARVVDDQHLETALVHDHLPYLDDHDVIDFRAAEDAIVVPESVGDRFPSILVRELGLEGDASDSGRDDDAGFTI